MVITNRSFLDEPVVTIGWWSPHMAASPNKPAKPNPESNRNFIPSGEIGTHAMHPPGKRSIDINK
jgi:hypothetical protein